MPFLGPLMQEEKKLATHRHIRTSRIESVGSCHPIKLSTSSFLRLGVRSTKGSNATPTRHLPKQQLTSQTNTTAKQNPTRSRPGFDHVLNDTIVSAVHTLEYKRHAGAGGGWILGRMVPASCTSLLSSSPRARGPIDCCTTRHGAVRVR